MKQRAWSKFNNLKLTGMAVLCLVAHASVQAGGSVPPLEQEFLDLAEVSAPNGTPEGFRIDTLIDDAEPQTTNLSNVGDFNGDGFDDFLLTVDSDGYSAEYSYDSFDEEFGVLVFGGPNRTDNLLIDEPTSIAPGQGITIRPSIFEGDYDNANNFIGFYEFAGDLNGDGFDDIYYVTRERDNLGAPVSPNGYNYNQDVRVNIIFGSANPSSFISDPDTVITDLFDQDFFSYGRAIIPIGDFNGDGFDDMLLSKRGFNIPADWTLTYSYGFFQNNTVGAIVFGDDTNFDPLSINDQISSSVLQTTQIEMTLEESAGGGITQGIGDFNNDGFDDIVIGSIGATTIVRTQTQVFFSGFSTDEFLNVIEVYNTVTSTVTNLFPDPNRPFGFDVIFGNPDRSAELNGQVIIKNFTVNYGYDSIASNVGDLNGDGFDDFTLKSQQSYRGYYSGANGGYYSPEVREQIIFGGEFSDVDFTGYQFLPGVQLITGNDPVGFPTADLDVVSIDYYNQQSRYDVSRGGDVNGDGINDLLIPLENTDIYNENTSANGAIAVVFGQSNLAQSDDLNLSSILPTQGMFVADSSDDSEDDFAESMAVGDFNNDGIDDLLANGDEYEYTIDSVINGGRNYGELGDAGRFYVVYGGSDVFTGATTPTGDNDGPVLDFDVVITNSTDFNLTGYAEDPSGVRRVSARIEGNGYLSPSPFPAQFFGDFPTTTTFSIPFSLPDLQEGIYNVNGTGIDNNQDEFGNDAFNSSTELFEAHLIYDITPPTFNDAFNSTNVSTTGATAPVIADTVYFNTTDGFLDVIYNDLTEVVLPLNIPITLRGADFASVNGTETIDPGAGLSGYRFDLTLGSEDEFEFVIPAGAVQDQAGNVATEEVVVPIVVDFTAPELLCVESFRALNSGALPGEDIFFTIAFTEPVVGVDANDFLISQGTGLIQSITPDSSTASETFTIRYAPGLGDTLVELTFSPDSSTQDLAGNTFSVDSPSAVARVSAPLEALPDPALLLPQDAEFGDLFGISVAAQGGTVVVGATKAELGGSAYVFDAVNVEVPVVLPSLTAPMDQQSTFTLAAELLAPGIALNDEYGAAVDVYGNWVAVGAPYADTNPTVNTGLNNGFVALFEYSDAASIPGAPGEKAIIPTAPTWNYHSTVRSSVQQSNARFGTSISLFGDTLAVGEPFDRRGGAVEIFTLDVCDNAWGFTQRIQPADLARLDNFGISISLQNDLLLIGSNRDDDRGSDTGSAYIYRRVNGAFVLDQKLVPATTARLDYLGTATSVQYPYMLLGAPGVDYVVGNSLRRDVGAGYLYGDAQVTQNGIGGPGLGFVPLAFISTQSIGLPSDGIGTTAALVTQFGAPTVVLGAPRSDLFIIDGGAAYVYDSGNLIGAPEVQTNGPAFFNFELRDVLSLPTPARNDQFGTSLDSTAEFVVVGAPEATHPEPEQGPVDSGLASFHNLGDERR